MASEDENYDDGFQGYVEDTVDPGIWLLLFTTIFCFFIMLVAMPIMVAWKVKWRNKQDEGKFELIAGKPQEEVTVSARSVVMPDKETKKILGLAIPFTVSALASSVLSNACLILVSRFAGTKSVAAYAIVEILVGLTDGVLKGPSKSAKCYQKQKFITSCVLFIFIIGIVWYVGFFSLCLHNFVLSCCWGWKFQASR